MPISPGTPPDSRFVDQDQAIPFGRYLGGDAAPDTANDTLVGRDGARAQVLELLRSMSRKGAILVTGHRGAGKTSFVAACLDEYEQDAYSRFLRGNAGRRFFLDQLLVLFIGALLTAAALLVHELLSVAVEWAAAAKASSGAWPHPRWIPVLLLTALGLSPLFYAWYMLRLSGSIYQHYFSYLLPQKWVQALPTAGGHVVAGAVLVALIGLTWFWLPFGGAPAISAGAMLLILSGVALLGQMGWLIVPALVLVCGVISQYLYTPYTLEQVAGLCVMTIPIYLIARRASAQAVTNLTQLARNQAHPIIISVLLGLWIVRLPSWAAAPPVWERLVVWTGAVVLAATHPWWTSELQTRGKSWWPPQNGRDTSGRLAGRGWIALCLYKACLAVLFALQISNPPLAAIQDRLLTAEVPQLQHLMGAVKPDPDRIPGATLSKNEPIPYRSAQPLAEVSAAFAPQRLDKVSSPSPPQAPVRYGFSTARTSHDELLWMLGLLAVGVLLFVVEYDLVVKPATSELGKAAVKNSGKTEEGERREQEGRRLRLTMLQSTLPMWLFKIWHPVLVVRVNLGFDRLEHGRVIQAMLASLRERYHEEFLSWGSGFANTRRLMLALLAIGVSTQLGDAWFHLGSQEGAPAHGDEVATAWDLHVAAERGQLCSGEVAGPTGRALLDLICSWESTGEAPDARTSLSVQAPDGATARSDATVTTTSQRDLGSVLVQALYLTNTTTSGEASPDLNRPVRRTDQLACLLIPCSTQEGKYLHFYHLLTLGLVLFAGRVIGRERWFAPYGQNLAELDGLLDQLSVRRTVRDATGIFQPVKALRGLLGGATEEERQFESIDPRVVEARLLGLLDAIQRPQVHLLQRIGVRASLPAPDLIFVFDELDKLGLQSEPTPAATTEPVGGEETAEQRRTVALHRLLADMKNLLSTAPARFFFVGGRDLHDEWLADQTDRRPLLTNIFKAEVYLPSLVVDPLDALGGANSDWTQRVREYIALQIDNARGMQALAAQTAAAPIYALPENEALSPVYGAWANTASCPDLFARGLYLAPPDPTALGGTLKRLPVSDGVALFDALSHFLTYRSVGNPKRMKELLEDLLYPVGVFAQRADDTGGRPFADSEHMLHISEGRRYRLQFISEIYQQIFHRFSAQSIRRDDKLPLALFYLSDFLFKFHRRGFSWANLERVDELVHIHRAHDHREVLEALVNCWSERYLHTIRNGLYDFRFRSSVAAEVEYLSRISEQEMAAFNFTLDEARALKSLYHRQIKDMGEGVTHDAYAGLGELYEFDQEFEQARHAYTMAITILDQRFNLLLSPHLETEFALPRIYVAGGHPDAVLGRRYLRSFVAWGVARLRLMLQIGMTFERGNSMERALAEYRDARTLARRVLRALLDDVGCGRDPSGDALEEDRLNALKHLNILYQPTLAEAWIAEKLPLGVDTSLKVIDEEIDELRSRLPFVRIRPDLRGAGSEHANFALTLAELHNKAGDLYFYKGVGYLDGAVHHYEQGLDQIRAFFCYRSQRGERSAGGWSDYMYRLLSGTLTDLAEARLARAGILGPRAPGNNNTLTGDPVSSRLDIWMNRVKAWTTTPSTSAPKWEDFFNRELLPSATGDPHLASVLLSLLSARMMSEAGHTEEAARQHEQVVELLAELAWGSQHTARLDGKLAYVPLWLDGCGVYAVEQAHQLYLRARGAGCDGRAGWAIPVSLVVATCSLDLALAPWTRPGAPFQARVSSLLPKIAGWIDAAPWTGAQRALELCLRRHPYPVLARLAALKAWIEHTTSKPAQGGLQDAVAQLVRLEGQVDAPLHFTNYQMGIALGLSYIQLHKTGQPSVDDLAQEALRHLRLSEEIVTMRRQYYDQVASMNYLYDDFNDRMLHFRHAVQMAGLQLTRELKKRLEA